MNIHTGFPTRLILVHSISPPVPDLSMGQDLCTIDMRVIIGQLAIQFGIPNQHKVNFINRLRVTRMLEKSIGILGLVLHRINGAIILVLMLIVSVDALLRYLFKSSIQWSFEVSEYIMAAIVFLSIAYIQAQKGHITMDVFVSRLSDRKRLIAGIITNFLVFGLFAIVSLKISSVTYELFRDGTTSSTATPMPLFYSHGMIALGCLAFCLQLIIDIYHDITKLTKIMRSKS